MKQKQLLIGLGLGLLVYYLYTRSKQKASATTEEKTNSNTTLPNAGGVVAPMQRPLPDNAVTPLTKEERTAINDAMQIGKIYYENDIIVTRLGNFKYVTIRKGTQSGISLGSAPIKDWVRTTEQPIVRTSVGGSLGALLK